MPLRVGEPAPPFDVTSSDGRRLRSEDFLGKSPLIVYFYPGDFTPLCTKETCDFRDSFDELAGLGAEVIGVSVDSDESHRKFREKFRLPFSLVSDPNRELAALFKAMTLFSRLTRTAARITYVIDKQGIVAGVFDSALAMSRHVRGAREVLEKLALRS